MGNFACAWSPDNELELFSTLLHTDTALESHKMVKVGRDLQYLSGQISLLKHGHLKHHLLRTNSRCFWNISEHGDTTTSLANLYKCLVTLTDE